MRTDYNKMPKAVHRDNKDNYNEDGWGSCGYAIRVPSLKRSKKTWENFYKLFPHIKKHLMTMGEYKIFRYGGVVSLKGNIYTVVDERSHGEVMMWKNGPGTRKRTTKYLKVW